jgi:hypothetical protein
MEDAAAVPAHEDTMTRKAWPSAETNGRRETGSVSPESEELGWEVEELRVRPILAAEKWPKVSHLRFEIVAHMTERIT